MENPRTFYIRYILTYYITKISDKQRAKSELNLKGINLQSQRVQYKIINTLKNISGRWYVERGAVEDAEGDTAKGQAIRLRLRTYTFQVWWQLRLKWGENMGMGWKSSLQYCLICPVSNQDNQSGISAQEQNLPHS